MNCSSSQCTAPLYNSHYNVHSITFHHITSHYITLHTLHYITLHYITLHYITLVCSVWRCPRLLRGSWVSVECVALPSSTAGSLVCLSPPWKLQYFAFYIVARAESHHIRYALNTTHDIALHCIRQQEDRLFLPH